YSHQTDILVGSPLAGRNRQEIEQLIGFFVNTLVMRTDLAGNPTFRELLGRVREVALGAYGHQDVPFEKLVEEIQPERSLSYSPLFQVVFAYQSAESAEVEANGLLMTRMDSVGLSVKFDLVLEIEETSEGLVAHFLYGTELFEPATIERMAGHFRTLLESVARDAETPLQDLPLLTSEERRRILFDWNETATPYPSTFCLHQLFERQVESTPDSVALIYEDAELTYAEVNRRANRLAHHLQSLGVRPETRVGILLERGVEMVLGVLAVLKAGGAYVPLDPQYPQERIAFMLEDAEASLLLTQEHLLENVGVERARVLCLDRDAHEWAEESAENPSSAVVPDNVIYVMYTSGSTGRPKGVAVTHRGVVNALWWQKSAFELDETDCLLLKASLSFDVSVWETFTGWLAGARVVVARHGAQQDSAYLVQTVARYKVTTIQFVPSLLPMFLEEKGLDAAAASLRRMAVGGEAMPVELLERLRSRLSLQVHDWYGPTEGSIGSVHWPDKGEPLRFAVSIGRPIDNTTAHVLDSRMQPVPAGVAGELYLGGLCVARGYWNRPDLTAERFIPDPFSREPGARLYRTGDLTRHLPDGRIEYLGRLDHQVKIRGLRIELEEIEATLGAHRGVRECVVMAREDAPGDKRLVAYIVAQQESSLNVAELRRYLREQLPDYMIPSAFVLLDKLPLTPSGKADRKALPAPRATSASEGYLAPRTAVEEMVSGIWSEVLKVERVGVRDNFFELGGHSLLATQVVSRLRDAFGVELPLSRFFESPVVAELSSFVEAEMRAGRVAEAPPLKAVPREGNAELPLSFAQQRLWFIDQLEPGNPVYNTPGAVRLTGALRIEALERTLAELIRRHETLRTAFRATTGGEPVQVIEEAEPFRLHVEDLSTIQPGERDGRARALALAEAQTPFDLSRGRLVRARLLRFGAQEHTLLVTMHHIISDGWSMGVLVGEVAALYEAYSTGKESPLEGLPIQYADYAVWQREWLQGSVLDEQLAYWREQLANAPAVLELPTDRPRPRVQTFRGASLPVSLPKSLTEALKALSRQTGATLYMTLLAAFQTLLGRYTGQTDILTGTPVANRRRAELEGLIGFFVNTLVMRTDLSGNPSFRELLTRVRQTALGAYAHQDVPFEMLVEELQPERSLSYTPLFQVLFVLQNAPSEALELEGLKASLLDVESGTAKFDLMLSLEETSEGLEGVCEYSTDLFDDRTVSRMLEHLRTLLVGAVESPERRINELPLLTEAERRALSEWNATASEFPREACIHELVAEQAARTPESTAIVFGEASLSYRELNERANRVAHHLRSLGIGAETVAAVMMERSIEMLVGVLGVLKAGGAYLPLDPEYPQERLAFMLEDARARVLLTEQRLAERLPETSAKVVCLDTDWKRIEEESPREPERNAASTSLAYVVYTSGSTGRPKAVVMPHRAAVNLVTYQMRSSGEAAATAARTLQFASLSFDVSFQEIFSTWAAGGALVLLREDERRDGSALLGVLREQRVERLFLPFVALQHLAEVAEAENVWPSSLRQVVTAGEQLKITPHLARLFSRLDRCILDNHYGPTETHLVSMHRLEGDPSDWPKLPPIGRPISNAEVYLLDDALQPVPAGVAGELYVGGAQLARCYLNRPGQTAERFIPNAFSSEPGARLYRTGDLARYRADGVLEYLGRRDLQVKVRGFRVEVGEVEAVLKLHAGVKQAVVAALEDEEGRKRLVAYLVAARKSSPPTSSDLRSYLRERLPDYMIPSAFVLLDRLPLTPNGKVDRTALPAPRAKSASESYVAPRTAVEELTAGIWSEVLKVERVGVRDNFFELGGHSLLATQVVSRLRRAFKVELPLRRLFEHPSLEELAGAIEAEMRAAEQIQAPPVVPRSRDAELPLSFAQQRLWFLDKLEPESSFYNLPSAISVRGKLDVGALERSLREVVRRHEVLRTTFETVGGQPRQVITEEPRFHLPVTDLSELPETTRSAEAQRLATEEAQRPFNLSEGALLRGLLVKLSDEEHVLLLTMHHIVSDGWSISIFIREVAALYEAFSTGKESPLEELSIQYADYAVWQREWLCGEVLDEQLAYWRRQLAGAPPALELPTDYPRPAVQTFNGATASEMLPRSLSQQLQALSRREGVTLYMTLLAAFQTLLSRYSHQTDILVGSPLAGRNRQEIEQLIGFFVNTLVMRTDLAGNPTF
ncbi:MAG TPA: amino acid adenylation domain-containing protein, partial [Pyrinomonadaceae bacterium]